MIHTVWTALSHQSSFAFGHCSLIGRWSILHPIPWCVKLDSLINNLILPVQRRVKIIKKQKTIFTKNTATASPTAPKRKIVILMEVLSYTKSQLRKMSNKALDEILEELTSLSDVLSERNGLIVMQTAFHQSRAATWSWYSWFLSREKHMAPGEVRTCRKWQFGEFWNKFHFAQIRCGSVSKTELVENRFRKIEPFSTSSACFGKLSNSSFDNSPNT